MKNSRENETLRRNTNENSIASFYFENRKWRKIQMEAIVYTSNTGSTEQYAKLLGYELGLSVYSTKEAENKLPAGTEIIYLGWIMAGKIQGYGKAKKKYKICAVCAVGMGQTGTQQKEIQDRNKISVKIPVFTLQGNFNVDKLHGMYKVMMNIMVKAVMKGLEKKMNRTTEEEEILGLMLHGGERVRKENLQGMIDWYKYNGRSL